LEIKSIKLTTKFPFGLLKKWWNVKVDSPTHSTYITPMLGSIDESTLLSLIEGLEEAGTVFQKGDGTELYGLREYQWSDSPKKINWKATAKRRSLNDGRWSPWWVRENEKDQDPIVRLAWEDAHLFHELPPEKIEQKVRTTASVIEYFQKQNRRVEFYLLTQTSLGLSEFHQVVNMWEFLALYQPADLSSSRLRTLMRPVPGLKDLRAVA
jgi:uncharacterized protein (DUF58 family)